MTHKEARASAKDWLEHHMTGDDESDYDNLASLLLEVDAAARKYEKERCSGHHQMLTAARCFECGDAWPCPTVRRIRSEESNP